LANRRGDVVEARAILHRLSALAQVAGDEYRILAGLSDLIDNDLAARNIEDAVQRGIELEQRLRAGRHLWNLTVVRINLTAALVLQGAIEAAHHMARVVWPMAVQFDVAAALADHLALLAALTERPAATARLLGYADRGYTSMSRARDLNELRAAQRAASLARASLGEAEFERLRAQPTTLTDDEVLPLALAAGDSADAAP
jgi:hypothetical protein